MLIDVRVVACSKFTPSCRFGDCSPIANTLRPVFTGLTAHMTLDLVRLLLFPSLMAFAAVSDLMTMTISNRISLLLVAGFIVLAALGGMSLFAISMHLAAGAAVLAFAFGCFAAGWIGGGDAKLAAATALWFGFEHL